MTVLFIDIRERLRTTETAVFIFAHTLPGGVQRHTTPPGATSGVWVHASDTTIPCSYLTPSYLLQAKGTFALDRHDLLRRQSPAHRQQLFEVRHFVLPRLQVAGSPSNPICGSAVDEAIQATAWRTKERKRVRTIGREHTVRMLSDKPNDDKPKRDPIASG